MVTCTDTHKTHISFIVAIVAALIVCFGAVTFAYADTVTLNDSGLVWRVDNRGVSPESFSVENGILRVDTPSSGYVYLNLCVDLATFNNNIGSTITLNRSLGTYLDGSYGGMNSSGQGIGEDISLRPFGLIGSNNLSPTLSPVSGSFFLGTIPYLSSDSVSYRDSNYSYDYTLVSPDSLTVYDDAYVPLFSIVLRMYDVHLVFDLTSPNLTVTADWLPSSGGGDLGYTGKSQIVLNPGNVLVLDDVQSGLDIILNGDNLAKSPIFGSWKSGQYYYAGSKLFSSLTSSSNLFNYGNEIVWNKKAGTTNWLGQTRTGVMSYSYSESIPEIWVTNPSIALSDRDSQITNSVVTVNLSDSSKIGSARIYQISQIGAAINIVEDSYVDVTIDSEGNVIYKNQDGNVVASPSYPQTNWYNETSLKSWFENLISGIQSVISVFTTGLSNFIATVGSFFAILPQLYSFLPVELQTIIITGFSLIVIIGVIKAMKG